MNITEKKIEETIEVLKNVDLAIKGVQDALALSDELMDFSKLKGKKRNVYENAFFSIIAVIYSPTDINDLQLNSLKKKQFFSIWRVLTAKLYSKSESNKLCKKDLDILKIISPFISIDEKKQLFQEIKGELKYIESLGIAFIEVINFDKKTGFMEDVIEKSLKNIKIKKHGF